MLITLGHEIYPCLKIKISQKVFVTTLNWGLGQATDEGTRSAMFAGAHAAYELKEISCLRACVSGVEGPLQRCVQECRQDAWESRHAYPEGSKASAGSLSLVEDLTMKNGVGLPCAKWSEARAAFLKSPRQGETSQHEVLRWRCGRLGPSTGCQEGLSHRPCRCEKLGL